MCALGVPSSVSIWRTLYENYVLGLWNGNILFERYSVQYKYLTAFKPLADVKILDWSKLKQIADYILKCI